MSGSVQDKVDEKYKEAAGGVLDARSKGWGIGWEEQDGVSPEYGVRFNLCQTKEKGDDRSLRTTSRLAEGLFKKNIFVWKKKARPLLEFRTGLIIIMIYLLNISGKYYLSYCSVNLQLGFVYFQGERERGEGSKGS